MTSIKNLCTSADIFMKDLNKGKKLTLEEMDELECILSFLIYNKYEGSEDEFRALYSNLRKVIYERWKLIMEKDDEHRN